MKQTEKQLLKNFRQLSQEDQNALLRFADFLAEKQVETPQIIEEPNFIEAVEGETVVGALKRLSATYFMLDKAAMLNETSTIMTQHVMQGRDKQEVINELESLFKTHYEKLKNR